MRKQDGLVSANFFLDGSIGDPTEPLYYLPKLHLSCSNHIQILFIIIEVDCLPLLARQHVAVQPPHKENLGAETGQVGHFLPYSKSSHYSSRTLGTVNCCDPDMHSHSPRPLYRARFNHGSISAPGNRAAPSQSCWGHLGRTQNFSGVGWNKGDSAHCHGGVFTTSPHLLSKASPPTLFPQCCTHCKKICSNKS